MTTPCDARALARPELAELPSYARTDAAARARLDANEVPWRPANDRSRPGLNRYPPVRAERLERRLAELYGVAADRVVATRGSDEAIDLLVRVFCRPGRDAVVVLPPTFGMYALAARIQGARAIEVPRRRGDGFAIDVAGVAARLDDGVKIVFVPDPDNPTGRACAPAEIAALARLTAGRALLVVDQAYAEFARDAARPRELLDLGPQVVVLRTLSKAHALAGVRCGAAVARPEVIELLARVLPPFPLGRPTIAAALAQLEPRALAATRRRVATLIAARERLARRLTGLRAVREVFPSAANFLLVALHDRGRAERALEGAGLAARAFEHPEIADCLRITVGSAAENRRLVAALESA